MTKKIILECNHIVKEDRNKKGKENTYYCPDCMKFIRASQRVL